MPNRILRDWTDSEKIDKLSSQEEILFTRLIMKADDFGNFYRNSSLVRSLLFPRKDGLRTSDIERWLQALEAAVLIRCYPAKGDSFLHIVNFRQRLDRKSRKFPKEPDFIDVDNHPPQSAASGSETPPETKRNELEVELEVELETQTENFSAEKKFLVPEMLLEWEKVFPNYPEKKEKDFTALREIAEFIAEKQGVDCDIGVIPLFKQLAEYIAAHDFFRSYSLMQVSKHIQNIVNTANNEQPASKNGKHGSNEGLRERVNKAFTKRYSRGTQ